ncbi:MAG: TetR/AcrR family transcriptional regulator [Chloroflexi bacterium]|nr:TetR/AcrR family transcriptional regulator [Chloroflexota bacterium]
MNSQETASSSRLEQIVTAAQRCLARDGYANVSIKDIAQEAGVAPGLLHYYFDSKEDLLVAAVQQAARRYREEFFSQLHISPDPARSLATSIEWVGRKLKEDPTWFLLLFELYGLSLRDERIRAELLRMLREERAMVTDVVSEILATSPERLGFSPESLGTLILSVFDGVSIHALIDPAVDPVQNLSMIARAIKALLPD